jgi:hypothetical protein
MHWLDAVRFADSAGFHGDNPIWPAWPYRDYVMRAFNGNKPFDQFTREQTGRGPPAGGDARAEGRLGLQPPELLHHRGGGCTAEGLRGASYLTDRVRTVGAVWLGQTVGCAQCHDHKFDPFTARDFYSLGAFFADIRRNRPDPGPRRTRLGLDAAAPERRAERPAAGTRRPHRGRLRSPRGEGAEPRRAPLGVGSPHARRTRSGRTGVAIPGACLGGVEPRGRAHRRQKTNWWTAPTTSEVR